ncbi:hypothetical protein [Halomonas alkalicola]|uniref:Uncharacterized protein n=1 Tax=Halomonas alkalicola TaxID=1930622 RepID=A0ABY9H735_9GAMM|nr:hypothetical protein [Halomonas alkalicola]WLI74286.1 hypothetical protein B6N23_05020 [Halomonas alkalicola]
MSPQHFMEMASFTLNLVGMLVLGGGLTLAHRTRHRVPGYLLAGAGFVIAASPLLYTMFAGPR